MASIPASKKTRGRPKTGIGKATGLRLYADLEVALQGWIVSQPDPKPSVPEAIRRILADYLRRRGYLPK